MIKITFETFAEDLRKHIGEMTKSGSLFVVDTDKDTLWDTYLSSFPEGTNLMFRERRTHDCSACRQFIRAFGNVVRIEDGKITSIWDFPALGEYALVAAALDAEVKSRPITGVFVSDTTKIGTENNKEKLPDGNVLIWTHLYAEVPKRFVVARKSLGTVRGDARGQRDVFKRSLDEITEDATLSILELIAQNSLYKGEEWKGVLEAFLEHQRTYSVLTTAEETELYAWEQSAQAGAVVGKIRNHSIGTLLVDISNGIDLDSAVRKYESIVAPTNYKRPKMIFSQKMLKDAEKTITNLGYLPSLGRRHARTDDITIGDIMFVNRSVAGKLGGVDVFSKMAQEIGMAPKSFDRVEEVPMSVFVSDILPTAQSIEVLLENHHAGNMMSLIAPENRDAPSMFKWGNGFSWAYSGNITDSMKERVKALGGDVSGVLRFSIQWNKRGDTLKENLDDLDAHCREPGGNEIFYLNMGVHPSSGVLDVDIIYPERDAPGGVAVENITWSDLAKMPDGVYKLFVHNYTHRGGKSGFTAEVEFDGQIHSFAYNQPLRQKEDVQVAEVTLHDGQFSIKEMIPSSQSSREIWGLSTNQFHPVSVIMHSPNHWDGEAGIGNYHTFFMLKDCRNPESPNGFFNEFLNNTLMPYNHVFEALGGKMRVDPTDDQLSGIGFSSTQRNTLVIRVTGHVGRTIRVTV